MRGARVTPPENAAPGRVLDHQLLSPYNGIMESRTRIATIGIVTVSDRAFREEYEDRSGPAIEQWLERTLATPWRREYRLVSDDQPLITGVLEELIDEKGCSLVLTTGGTGPAPRDVTPEAVRSVCSRMLPGFGEQMRRASLESVPTAILSRQEAGVRNACLVISLPGHPAAIAECLDAVFAAVPYAIDLIGGAWIDTNRDRIASFRPAHARRPETAH